MGTVTSKHQNALNSHSHFGDIDYSVIKTEPGAGENDSRFNKLELHNMELKYKTLIQEYENNIFKLKSHVRKRWMRLEL